MTIEEKKTPRTQYQTGPRHGQQLAAARKIVTSWRLTCIHRELRAFGYAWALGSW